MTHLSMSVVSNADVVSIVIISDSFNVKTGGNLAISEVANEDVHIIMASENLQLHLTMICIVLVPGYDWRRNSRHMAHKSDGVSWMLEINVF